MEKRNTQKPRGKTGKDNVISEELSKSVTSSIMNVPVPPPTPHPKPAFFNLKTEKPTTAYSVTPEIILIETVEKRNTQKQRGKTGNYHPFNLHFIGVFCF